MKRERMRLMEINTPYPRALLALLAAAVLAAGLLALAGTKPALAADPSFAQAQNFPVGSGPETVASADFNADDNVDLAVSNRLSGNVSVLLGNSDGTFQAKQDFAVGPGPSSVTAADFNGDNKADLAVTNTTHRFSSRNVSIWLSNGDGTFQAKQDLLMWSYPSSVISADYNGDGKIDHATSNSSTESPSVSVWLGNGDGTFQAKENFEVDGYDPNQLITADFNGDGKVDLATSNSGYCHDFDCHPGGISVLLGNGDGTFQDAQAYPTGEETSSITAADFNDDGKADLAATLSHSNVVWRLLGTGTGTFKVDNTALKIPVGTYPSSATAADFDGDRKPDLAVANKNSNNVSVLFGDGNGNFQAAQDFPAGDGPAFIIGEEPEELRLGTDFNGDKKADLAVANRNSNNVTVLLNTTVDITAPTVIGVSPADGTTGVAVNTNAEATFSENMDWNTLTTSTFMLTKQGSSSPVAARVIYDSANKKATLFPASDLEASTSYTATIKSGSSGVTDAIGNPLAADKVWTFSTVDTTAPSVPVITSPAEGSTFNVRSFTVSGTAEKGAKVELFEEAVSKDKATAGSDGAWSIALGSVSDGSHSYKAKATDEAGNTSAESEARTVIVDATKPTVKRVVPAENATGIAPGANVSALFSEAMDASSISDRTFKLYKKGSTTALATTVTYDAATKRAVLNPSANLQRGATYKAVVSAGVRDQAGNALDQDPNITGNQQKVWFFTVRN
jgi:hypothetical protein